MYAVLKYIHDHIQSPMLAGDIAKAFGYSKWYFCDRFKDFTGRTFVEYVRHYRVQLAAMEILLGQKKIADIAMDYGYHSISGFHKAFLKEYGCSPSEFVKQTNESQLYYEKRKIAMFQLSDRCAALREEVVNKREYQDRFRAQRTVYYTIGQDSAYMDGISRPECIANGIAYTLDRFTPVILPDELIVGFNYAFDGAIDPEWGHYTAEHRALMRQSGIADEDIDRYLTLRETAPAWLDPALAPVLTKAEQETEQEWSAIGRCITANHTVLGYEQVLKKGFSGLLADVRDAAAKNGDSPLYRAAAAICRAAEHMGEKYADAARALLAEENENYNRADLEQIIRVCERVPRYPATSFIEAVQSLWFAHIVNTWEDTINANSIGRLDQILYPYYQADIEKGILTKEQAFEIVCCLWIKLYRDYDVQQSCVGGTHPDGTSAVNDLSYMMLDATEQLNFIRCLSVRYSAGTERAFLRRALEVVGHVQKGVPFFFNDDVMIPALMAQGIAREDAHDYTQIGCVETVIPGRSNPHAVSGETNLLKAIEYVLCDGSSLLYPAMHPGVETGPLDSFKTYDQLFAAVLAQIDRMLELSCSKVNKHRIADITLDPRPYKALLTEGCLETGRDFNDGGAQYDYYQIMLGGIPNLADSLAVIKKFVYDEKRYTLAEVKEILANNFPDEAVRTEWINKAPKYGNDIDEVDEIAVAVMNHACDTLEQLSKEYGLAFHAQPFTFLWMIEHGQHSAASPDGRRQGEPIAYSCSSMQGRDFNGLTALLNSIAKLPSTRAAGTTSSIVEVDPKLFCDRNLDALTDIFIAASGKGLCNVQFNIVDAETLMDAQKHPEHYNNLAVRVSGFSQKFNLISPELQNHIIGRTKHTCL